MQESYQLMPNTVANLGTDQIALSVMALKAGNVDKGKGVLRDVIMAQVGDAEGHGVAVEKSFLQDVLNFANKESNGRVQSNLGHNWDNMTKQLGRFSNIRLNDDQLIGDLNIYKAASISPVGNLADWVIELATEDAHALNCSLAFEPAGHYQYDDKGNKVYIDFRWYDPESIRYKDRKVFVEFGKLISCDIVDRGAITDKLFDAGSLASVQQRLLVTPGYFDMLDEYSDQFEELRNHFEAKTAKTFFSKIKAFFSQSTDMETTNNTNDQAQEQAQDQQQEGREANDQGQEQATDFAALQKKVDQFMSKLEEKDQQIKELQDTIADLENEPADQEAAGKETDEGGQADKAMYWNNPVTQKAMGFHRKRESK